MPQWTPEAHQQQTERHTTAYELPAANPAAAPLLTV